MVGPTDSINIRGHISAGVGAAVARALTLVDGTAVTLASWKGSAEPLG